jgi:8-oxo-dGTP pyrophosphatase MutT (NUDIX family)
VLLVQRRDNQQWVMPAGSIELDEPILDALKREVWEESGLEVTAATLIAVYSDPRFSITTAYGDSYQIIAFVFRVDAWDSALAAETDETISARFFPLDALPAMYHETLADLLRFDGTVILK